MSDNGGDVSHPYRRSLGTVTVAVRINRLPEWCILHSLAVTCMAVKRIVSTSIDADSEVVFSEGSMCVFNVMMIFLQPMAHRCAVVKLVKNMAPHSAHNIWDPRWLATSKNSVSQAHDMANQ